MDQEQLLKRIQWIEEDRRKEKDILSLLENRIASYEGSLTVSQQQVKELNGEVTRLSAIITRMDQFDQLLLQTRLEAKKANEEMLKGIKTKLDEADKVHRVEIKGLDTNLAELRKSLEIIPKLEKGIQLRADDDVIIRRSVDEMKGKIEQVSTEEQEYTRTVRLLEDGRRQDAKRILDLQGELSGLRKRLDDQRGQTELLNVTQHKLESRLTELVNVENERRDTMSGFLDKQSLVQVERDRTWKDWQVRFETIEKQTMEIENQLQALDTTFREVKRTQTVVDELTQRVDRRINEITEIQRLSEDRFRQEWVSFKADDQKRWTNYTLNQEEQRNETKRQFDKLATKSSQMDDEMHEIKDWIELSNEQVEKRLQALLTMAHEWVSSYEQALGRSR